MEQLSQNSTLPDFFAIRGKTPTATSHALQAMTGRRMNGRGRRSALPLAVANARQKAVRFRLLSNLRMHSSPPADQLPLLLYLCRIFLEKRNKKTRRGSWRRAFFSAIVVELPANGQGADVAQKLTERRRGWRQRPSWRRPRRLRAPAGKKQGMLTGGNFRGKKGSGG